MFTNQDEKGVADYLSISSLIQEKTFDVLIQKFPSQNGMKIIDIGCGTGNNSFKLSQMVGENGKVLGTDPIKERIQKAQETFSAPNLEFLEGFGKEAPQFGNDFDLCVSSTVLHWIPPEEKLPSFEGICQCLKPNGSFIFNTVKFNTLNAGALFYGIKEEVLNQINNHYHPSSKEELKELALRSGFKEVCIEEEDICIILPSLDHYMHWFAASLHVEDYQVLLKELQEVCSKEDVSYLYNNEGQVVYKQSYFYGICSK